MKQGWEIKKLGEVCEILDHLRVPITKKDRREGVYPYYGASGIQDYVDSYIFDGRYLLVGEDGAKWGANDKSAYIIEGKSWVNNHAHILKLNDIISDRLVEYYLVLKDLQEYITGAVVPKLTQQALRNIPIPIPPREEQERIVEELDCLSGVIDKKREQLRELDALVQSIFYTMFGDPITNEKCWAVKKLEELCDIINGFAFPSSDFAECNPIKVIKITNVGVNEFISDDSSLPEEYNNMEGCKVHTGDIVIALTRTIISTGVKRAIVPNEYNESLVNQRVAAILANDRIVSRRFIYSFLGTDFVRQYILQKATALMQPNLSIRDLRDMPTIYPPLALQQEFADKIEAIEKQKELIKQSITQTETLFNSRMAYYFN